MTLSVTINQTGKPAGVAGQAREDLDTGIAVSLSAGGGPYLAYQWQFVGRPVDLLANVRSSATIAAPGASTTSIAPIDVAGTYGGRLVVDSGSGLGASEADIVEWSFYAGISGDPLRGQPAAAGDELPGRTPSPGERAAHNAPDLIDPSGNIDGWARALEKWFEVARRLYSRQLFAAAVVTNDGVSATLGRNRGIASVLRTGLGVVEVTFDGIFPDADYLVGILPIGTLGGSGTATSRTAAGFVANRADPGGSFADGDFILLVALRF